MKSKSILAFLAGTAIGAGLAILFAPNKGSETRKKIKERAKNDYETIKSKMKDAKLKVENELKDKNTAE